MKQDKEKRNRLPVFTERFRELQGEMSNTEFAAFLGMSRQTVGFYCNGDRIPDAVGLKDIAEKCNVSADYLLGLTNVCSPDPIIRKITQYTGLDERSISKLHEFSTCIKEHEATIAFIDHFLSQITMDIFEESMELAIMARNAYNNLDMRNGGPIDFEELALMSDDERKFLYASAKNSMQEHRTNILNGKEIRLKFDDAEFFFANKASNFLRGVVYSCVQNFSEEDKK